MLKLVRFITSIVIAVALALSPVSAVAEQNGTEKQNDVARLLKMIDLIEAQIDPTVYELDAAAGAAGSCIECVSETLRENFVFRPYFGALKGPGGVLIDREANSLDLSLLAIELLRNAGVEKRIGSATIQVQAAQQLLDATRERVPVFPDPLGDGAALIAAITADEIVQPEHVAADIAEAKLFYSEMSEFFADAYGEFLSEVRGQNGLAEELGQHTQQYNEIAKTREFYWPEYLSENGEWLPIEIYPLPIAQLLQDAEPGAFITDFEKLNERLLYNVRIAINLDVERNGAIEKEQLHEASAASHLAAGKDIVFASSPVTDFTKPYPNAPDSYNFNAWVDNRQVAIKNYNKQGQITDLRTAQGGATEKAANVLTNAFAPVMNLGGGSSGNPGTLKALSIDYTITESRGLGDVPRVRNFNRRIFEEADAPQGSALAFETEWSERVSLIPYEMSYRYYQYRSLTAFLSAARLMAPRLIAGMEIAPGQDNLRDRDLSVGHLTAALATEIAKHGLKDGNSYFSSGLSVVVEENSLSLFHEDGPLVWFSVDLLSISGVVSGSDGFSYGPDHGLYWTLAETIALQLQFGNAGSEFIAGLRNGSDPVTFRDLAAFDASAAANSGSQPFPPDSNVRQEFENNHAVAAFVSGGNPTWLSIDRETGLAIGREPGGRGGSSTETGVLLSEVAQAADFASAMVDGIICVVSPPAEVYGTASTASLKYYGSCMASAATGVFGSLNRAGGIAGLLWSAFSCARSWNSSSSKEIAVASCALNLMGGATGLIGGDAGKFLGNRSWQKWYKNLTYGKKLNFLKDAGPLVASRSMITRYQAAGSIAGSSASIVGRHSAWALGYFGAD